MPGLELFANQAQTTVSSGGTTAPAAGTSQTWTVASSSGFPAASSAASPPTFFRITDPNLSSEKILVTNVSGTTWTVTRGAEGTTPVAHASGFTVQNVLTAAALEELVQMAAVGLLLPSGDETGVTDAAAIALAVSQLPASGGVVRLAPTAQWYIECGQVVINASGVYIDGTGCVINAVGSGDMIDMHDTSDFGDRTLHGGGILGFPHIDGSATTGNATAFHGGDILQLALFFQAQNFTAGTTSKGAWLDNRYYWTEHAHGRIFTENCTTGVVLDVSAANTNNTGSFMRCNLDLYTDQVGPTFNGVVLQNGAFIQDGEISIRGNFGTSDTVLTSAVLVINGVTPSGTAQANTSNISDSVLNIGCELDVGDTYAPYTVYFGTDTNYVASCTGNIDFGAGGTFTSSNNGGQFTGFVGAVFGDSNLPTALPQGSTNLADSNQTISAITATAITNVSAPVAAYTAYKIEIYIPHVAAAATGDYTFALGGPSIALASLDVKLWTGATLTEHYLNVATGTLVPNTVAPSASQRTLEVAGAIAFAAGGAVTVTCSRTSSSSNVTVDIGAYILLTPLSAP